MKRLFLILILLFLHLTPAQAQESGFKVYLPMVFKMALNNSWRIIQAVQSSNYVLNPSAETTGNFSAVASATVTRVTTYQKYGLYSYQVTAGAVGRGVQLTLSALTNVEHFVTVRARGNSNLRATIGSAVKPLTFIEKIDDSWSLYGAPFSKAQVSGQTALQITVSQPGNFYVDGIQVEPLPYWTTYIDGTQEGCEWLGAAHGAISQRSAESRAGGRSVDLYEAYGFFVEKVVGAGSATKSLGIDSYAVLPGGELNNVKVQAREFSLVGKFIADSEAELHDNRQALEAILDDASHPSSQPVRLRFNGASVQKEIGVHYRGGLEGDLAAFYGKFDAGNDTWTRLNKFTERAAIQLSAPNPYWLEVGESAAELDTNDSATFQTVAGRLRSTGQWSALGPPSGILGYLDIRAIAEDATYVYFGGGFTSFDGIAAASYIVRYNKHTGAYSALGSGLSGPVWALAIAPNGDLYIAGEFLNAGGVADADYLARWDGSNFYAVGVPNTGTAAINIVYALKFNHTGNLFIGGDFANWNNIAAADNIVMWNGSAYSALSTGVNNTVRALAIGLDNTLYLGGFFTSPASYVAAWNGSALTALGSGGPSSIVYALAVDLSGILFAGQAGTPFIQSWNGQAWSTLGDGVNDAVTGLTVGADNILFVSGLFTQVGSVALADRTARWNGYAWAHLDIDLPGIPTTVIVYASKYVDTVVRQKYDLYLGFDVVSGTGNFAGKTTVTNGGSVPAFPKIIYYRSGGTSAIIETLKNERTGKELLFNYSLLDGETLTIDLKPINKSIVSSFFGARADAILANSDFGTWSLLKGDNSVTSFVAVSGSPTITAYCLWRDAYDGYD